MAEEFKHVSDAELGAGIQYALSEREINLNRDILRAVANETGKLRRIDGKEFRAACQEAAKKILPQRDKIESARYLAYIGAVGKIFNYRSQQSKLAKAPQKMEKLEKKSQVGLPPENERGQFEFVLHPPSS